MTLNSALSIISAWCIASSLVLTIAIKNNYCTHSDYRLFFTWLRYSLSGDIFLFIIPLVMNILIIAAVLFTTLRYTLSNKTLCAVAVCLSIALSGYLGLGLELRGSIALFDQALTSAVKSSDMGLIFSIHHAFISLCAD